MIFFFFNVPNDELPDATTVLPAHYGDILPIDHEKLGLVRILEQFKDKTGVKAFCFAQLPQSQALETAIFDLLEKRGLDTATGQQLDDLGDLLDLTRAELGDAEYRLRLKAQMLIYRSSGTVEQIYAPFVLLEPTANLAQVDAFPAGFVFEWLSPPLPSSNDTARYALMLQRVRGAGIGAWFYWYPVDSSLIFRFAVAMDVVDVSSPIGFSDITMTTGGKLAGIVGA